MKKVKALFMVAILISAVFLFSVSIIGCGEKTQLDTPSLSIMGDVLEWNAVQNTCDYIVDIDGEVYPFSLEATYHEMRRLNLEFLTQIKTYNIKVKAKGDGKKYTDSDFSQVVKFSWKTSGLELLPIGWLNETDDESAYGVARGQANEKNVIIPEYYNNKPVTVIWTSGFSDCYELESITLSNNIQSIEEYAFMRCYNLREIIIPASVTHVGAFTFNLCESTIIKVRGYSAAPAGWHTDWNFQNCQVIWDYNG